LGGGGNIELHWRNAAAEEVTDRIEFIEFREADARNMPFANRTFDVMLSSGALHHISHNPADHEHAVREMVRVLKPGGQIMLWGVTRMIDASASRNAAGRCSVRDQRDRRISRV